MTRLVVYAVLNGDVTGGIEALYQLTAAARALGVEAVMTAPEGVSMRPVPSDYEQYASERITHEAVRKDDVVVVPEIWLARRELVSHPRVVFWWLSVDNGVPPLYTMKRRSPAESARWMKRAARRTYYLNVLLPSLLRRRNVLHAAQSEYARAFLAERGVEAAPLSDYIGHDFTERATTLSTTEPRSHRLAVNPKKGRDLVSAALDGWECSPLLVLSGLDRAGMASALSRSEAYLDLGHHPGRDRIPREAALCGCVVVVARRGSAANDKDVPLPEEYKFDIARPTWVAGLRDLLDEIHLDPGAHRARQAAYREWVLSGERVFKDEVASLLARLELA